MTGKADAVRAVTQQFKDRTNTVIEGVMAHLRDDNAKEILGPGLSPLIGRGTLKGLVTFAIYADVLRMVRDMVMADGEISDEEVQESLGLLQVIAGGFAKVRGKDYAAFKQLTPETAREFLSQYESDTGLFGHANEATKWAGVALCRNIQSNCGDSGPIDAFGGSIVAWAEAIAGSDGLDVGEQVTLESLRVCVGARATDALEKARQRVAHHNVLTKEVAESFLRSDGELSLEDCTTIDATAAAVLSRHHGELCLDSLTDVSVEALAALSQHRGAIQLRGLHNISKEHATALAGFLSGVEVPVDECEPEVQEILLSHPSLRVHEDSELTDWLLAALDFDDEVDNGRDWLNEDVLGGLLDACTCWQSADPENGQEMMGSSLDDIMSAVKAAGRREIHVVSLRNSDESVFMFVGTLDEIKTRLLPIISVENKKNPIEDEDEDEDEDGDEDEYDE